MATRSMGTLTLNLVMQMGGFEQGADRAERAMEKVGKAAERQKNDLMRLLGQIDPVVAEYDRLEKAGTKLKSSLESGLIDQNTFNAFNAKLAEQKKRLDQSGDGFVYGALSAKQYQQALRGMPAQITDLIVSLQAGQNPLTVFLQQGGQIKDMFGGIGPAISGMTRAVVGMINPVSLAAVALGTLGVAAIKGQNETAALGKSLALTGNRLGLTTSELQDMAAAIDSSSEAVSQSAASEVLNALVRDGRVASGSIGEVAEAISLMAATGEADVGKLIEAFGKMGEDPVKAVTELNKAYSFLTPAIYDQIRAAQEAGDTEKALELATKAGTEALKLRASQIEASTSDIEKAWRAIKNSAKEAWDEMLGVGRSNQIGERIRKLREQINVTEAGGNYFTGGVGFGGLEAARSELAVLEAQEATQKKAAKATAEQTKETNTYVKAQEAVAKAHESSRSAVEKANEELKKYRKNIEEIRKINPNAAELDPAVIARTEKSILDKAKTGTRGGSTPKGKDPLDVEVNNIKRAAKLEADIYRDRNRVIELYNSQNLLTTREYYDAQRVALEENTAAQQAAIEAQIEVLRKKKNAQDQINALVAQSIEIEREAAAKRTELDLKQSGAEEQKRIADALERVNDIRTESSNILSQLQRDEERINIARQVGAEGEIESLIKLGEARREAYAALLAQIELYERLEAIDPAGLSDKQRKELEKLAPAIDGIRLQAEKLAADLDPLGSKINGIFKDAFADAFTDFITGSKTASEAFAAFGQSVINQLARIAAQQLAMSIFSSFMGAFGGASGSFFTPDSNAAIMGGYGAFSYSSGGYTGPGGKYDPAGIVHAGEYVFSQEDVRAAGGPAGMDALRKGLRGYASGGYVASPSAPTMPAQAPAAAPRIINVLDPSLVGDYLATDAGEEIILNIMQRNQRAFA